MFQGSINNSMQVVDDEFASRSPGALDTIALEMKRLRKIAKSLQSWLPSERVTTENCLSVDDRKINTCKFSHIQCASEATVRQFKCYEYDWASARRITINDRYEFPITLDIAQCMAGPADQMVYRLQGVILHSGTAQPGH
jgi:ubiquitin carboxyl-terminal hydrolase 7